MMPKAVHDALERAGRKKGYTGERLENFIYGTMYNMTHGKGRWAGKKANIKWDKKIRKHVIA